jgi:hypothetical protein
MLPKRLPRSNRPRDSAGGGGSRSKFHTTRCGLVVFHVTRSITHHQRRHPTTILSLPYMSTQYSVLPITPRLSSSMIRLTRLA